jgi:hypothetical protein
MRNNVSKIKFTAGFFLLTSSLLLAGRPLSTDDAGIVPCGHLESETGIEFLKQPNNDKETAIALALTTGFFIDKADIGIEIPYLWTEPENNTNQNGFGDLAARIKLRIFDETLYIPSFAITAGIKPETGESSKGLGSGKVDYPINVIITKELKGFSLYANAGYNFVGDIAEEREYDLINLSLAAEYSLSEKIKLAAEMVVEIFTDNIDENEPCDLLFGGTYELPNGATIDGGIAAGLTDGSPDYRFTFGITHEF